MHATNVVCASCPVADLFAKSSIDWLCYVQAAIRRATDHSYEYSRGMPRGGRKIENETVHSIDHMLVSKSGQVAAGHKIESEAGK